MHSSIIREIWLNFMALSTRKTEKNQEMAQSLKYFSRSLSLISSGNLLYS
jgi:hypothetical protein